MKLGGDIQIAPSNMVGEAVFAAPTKMKRIDRAAPLRLRGQPMQPPLDPPVVGFTFDDLPVLAVANGAVYVAQILFVLLYRKYEPVNYQAACFVCKFIHRASI